MRHQRRAGAFGQECACAGEADAFAAAGDEDVFVGEFEIHSWDERVKKAKFGDYPDYQLLRESPIYSTSH